MPRSLLLNVKKSSNMRWFCFKGGDWVKMANVNFMVDSRSVLNINLWTSETICMPTFSTEFFIIQVLETIFTSIFAVPLDWLDSDLNVMCLDKTAVQRSFCCPALSLRRHVPMSNPIYVLSIVIIICYKKYLWKNQSLLRDSDIEN